MPKKSSSKTSSEGNKRRYANYLTRSTCPSCRVVFRSPKKRREHTDSGHQSMVGVNRNRAAKSSALTK